MSPTTEGHSLVSQRPYATHKLLWRVERPSGTMWRWDWEARLHASPEDAYDAAGLDPSQAPAKEP